TLVNVLVNALTSCLPVYFSDEGIDLEGTQNGYMPPDQNGNPHFSPTLIPGNLSQTMNPPAANSSTVEKIAWINNTLRQMRATFVGVLGDGAIAGNKDVVAVSMQDDD